MRGERGRRRLLLAAGKSQGEVRRSRLTRVVLCSMPCRAAQGSINQSINQAFLVGP